MVFLSAHSEDVHFMFTVERGVEAEGFCSMVQWMTSVALMENSIASFAFACFVWLSVLVRLLLMFTQLLGQFGIENPCSSTDMFCPRAPSKNLCITLYEFDGLEDM